MQQDQLAPPRQGPLRVFLSSTSVDLEADRTQVQHLVEHLGQFAVVMDRFALRPQLDATRVSLDELRSCDLYLLLVAWRYGYVPAGEDLAVTHREYREARQLGLPCYLFLADPITDADDGPQARYPAVVRDVAHRAQLEAFRTELQTDQLVGFFTSPGDLLSKVAAALLEYLRERDLRQRTEQARVPLSLPPVVPGFVGREADLVALCADLRKGRSTSLSAAVVGMAGVGKSALAFQAMHTLAREEPQPFPRGLTWVRCDGRSGWEGLAWVYDQLLAEWDHMLAREDLVRVAALPLEAGLDMREHQLRLSLARRSPSSSSPGISHASSTLTSRSTMSAALVLLDHVEPGLPLARALRVLTPLGVTLLMTARQEPAAPQLRVRYLDVLDPVFARQLFAERYQERGGAWDPAHDTGPADKIITRLSRLPLAIEEATARAARSNLGVAGLARELQDAAQEQTRAAKNEKHRRRQDAIAGRQVKRSRYRRDGLKMSAVSVWLCAACVAISAGAAIGIATATWQLSSLAVGAVSLLSYRLGYRRAMSTIALITVASISAAAAFGIVWMSSIIPASSLQSFHDPYIGLIRLQGNGGLFGQSFAAILGIPGLVIGAIAGFVFGVRDNPGRAEDQGIYASFGLLAGLVAGWAAFTLAGLLLGISIGFLGWLSSGLSLGAVAGVLIGLASVGSEDVGRAVATALGVLLVISLLCGFVWTQFYSFPWTVVYMWVAGAAGGIVSGAGIGATLRIWCMVSPLSSPNEYTARA